MTRRNVFTVAILVIAIGVSCSKEQPQQFDDARFITDAYNEWERSTHARDIEWWSSFVAPNAVFLPPDSPPLESIDAIRDYYEALLWPGLAVRVKRPSPRRPANSEAAPVNGQRSGFV